MTDRELLELLLQKVTGIENRLDKMDSKMDTEFLNLKQADTALLDLVEKTYREAESLPRVEAKIDLLAKRLFENEAEIALLKRAK